LSLKPNPICYKFHKHLYLPISVQKGINNISIPLAGITGNICALYFTVQTISDLTVMPVVIANNSTTFQQIAEFNILDKNCNSLTGGNFISDAVSRLKLGKDYFDTTFLSDLTETPNYVYFYSFSTNIKRAVINGEFLGSQVFSGNEILQIKLVNLLSTISQINIWAIKECSMLF